MATTITAQRAQEFGIQGQRIGESDSSFRTRVAGALRDKGHFIEAHEAQQDALYDQNEDVMTGIMGALAQQIAGKNYGSSGPDQVGDDIAAGAIAKTPKDKSGGMLGLLAILLSK